MRTPATGLERAAQDILRRSPRVALAFALAIASGLPAVGQAAPLPADAEPTVALPPFFVETSNRPLRWNYVEIPGLELLTTCSPDIARDFAETYLRQNQLIGRLVPGRYVDPTAVPTVVLLIDAATSRRITDDTMAKVLRKHTPQTVRRRDRARVMPNLRLPDRDRVAVMTLRQQNAPDSVGFSFTTSRFASLLERRAPALPLWLAAGLIGVYDDCSFGAQSIKVDSTDWRSPSEVEAIRADPDWPRDVPPLPLLFGRVPPATDGPARHGWIEQATLFVRWALLADEGRRSAALWHFVDHCLEDGPTEEAFRASFGLGFADARDRLSDYLPVAVQDGFELRWEDFPPPSRIIARRATPLDIGRLRAEWERLAVEFARQHHPELAPAYLEQARLTLDRARRAAGDEPVLLGLSGLLEYNAGNFAAAGHQLAAAVAAGETRPLVCATLARLRYDDAIAALPPHSRLSPAQTGVVLAPLAAARRQQPPLPEVYLLLGDLWLNSEMTPDSADLEALVDGTRLYPAMPAIVGRATLLLALSDRREEALAIVGASLARTSERTTRGAFERMQLRLQTLPIAP